MRQSSNSQAMKALMHLRQLILDGRIEAEMRLTEARAVELTGVSRTPVRAALQRLAEEGLVRELPSGGYDVQTFTEAFIGDAIELRGTLEGLAARMAVERGISQSDIARLRSLVSEMDEQLHRAAMGETGLNHYAELNGQFHRLLAEAAASEPILQALERAMATPFASPSAFVALQGILPEARQILLVANDQHCCIVDALEARESTRIESLMREHARLAMRNLRIGVANTDLLQQVPGGNLLRTEIADSPPKRPRVIADTQ